MTPIPEWFIWYMVVWFMGVLRVSGYFLAQWLVYDRERAENEW